MDIVCFSHLRWNFVYQRPQHLLSRFAKVGRVFMIEEPVADSRTWMEFNTPEPSVVVLTPHIDQHAVHDTQLLLDGLLREAGEEHSIDNFIAWFYTPMALPLLKNFYQPDLVIYDCMDELSAFKNAPPMLRSHEQELMTLADIVFTGGHNLYRAKKALHHNIHPFPSSIDKKHFGQARFVTEIPPDQQIVKGIKLGFFGVIDERFDISLIAEVADKRPDWNIILIGPVVKVDPATLPQNKNIYYLGSKSYQELPSYLAGWDVALIPFAMNESTEFISPTKTPEYLAGGKPVVSTPIKDVVEPYGTNGLVYIAGTADEFIEGIEWALALKDSAAWLKAVDHQLADNSWDNTWEKMMFQINIASKKTMQPPNKFYQHV